MLEILVGVLALTNIVTLVLFVRSVDSGDGKKYNIVEFHTGRVMQGPLRMNKALRAQGKWDDAFVFDGGPRTCIEVARDKH